ncbi:MBL fold metallo-hydrolase [Glycomyces harbinensis]|uniref:Glyoxylase, beta-lactamase superfamily II n=1 Tax=Glycomyces harbinensis TaxID=58114 RepID=A0A1G7CFY5_9ACTN|nr:MBL fold metallo-hydrolase [Glycomyces harbinensis]SDE37606.1 Glyoxylase, beta-lactamase superfamily II [Glycomyces harbinensis]
MTYRTRTFGPGGCVPDLDAAWHAGWPSPKHDPAPEIQSHRAEEHTVIMRQNMSVNFEAPFLFLLFGNESALLIDTGATPEPEYFPLREVVDAHIADWLERHRRSDYRLIVAHTHGHGDHKAADGQFAGRPDTVVVGPDVEAVTEYYGFGDWPNGTREIDLGGRVVDVVPGPGHQMAATVFYDRWTRLLLTGDTFYPGRLYVQDWGAYVDTVDRLVAWCEEHPVSHLLGCHVEMSARPGKDYPRGSTYQPDEAALPMRVSQLTALQQALREIDGKPGIHRYDDFHVWYEVD